MSSPTSPGPLQGPTGLSKPSSLSLNMNVRNVFESDSIEQTRIISKKINLEIGKKQEELRMLVGERYRDLIDAADTIGTMRLSSISIFNQLSSLRDELSTIPTRLVPYANNREKRVTQEELEILMELKLCMEIPREIQVLLQNRHISTALHFTIFYDQILYPRIEPYRWALFAQCSHETSQVAQDLQNTVMTAVHEYIHDFNTPLLELAECLVAKQMITKKSISEVLGEFLEKRLQQFQEGLNEGNDDCVNNLGDTCQAIYAIFIDPQVYSNASKLMRNPKIKMTTFGLKSIPKCVEKFNENSLYVEDSPRVAQLAQVVLQVFVTPLKDMFAQRIETYLLEEKNFAHLYLYKEKTMQLLLEKTDDLMKIVLGTSKSLWSEVFNPIFEHRSRQIALEWIDRIIHFVQEDALPRFQKQEDQYDLVSFVWKPAKLDDKCVSSGGTFYDVDLKLKCYSTLVASICEELETSFQEMYKDFLHLNKDSSLKQFLSSNVVKAFTTLSETVVKNSTRRNGNLPFARLFSAINQLCPTLWKLVEKNNIVEMKRMLDAVCEQCWTEWCDTITLKFSEDLRSKMPNLSQFTISQFMPVGEDVVGAGVEDVKASIRVPYQLSHVLHSLLYGICVDVAKIGPQSIPKNVRDKFRKEIGMAIHDVYQRLVSKTQAAGEDEVITSQLAAQLIFDLKFSQWFHSKLPELMEPSSVFTTLYSKIDPFDLDLVNPKLKVNLKRFLFETHLTLGLLLGEENQSFIAQNFKTKEHRGFIKSHSALSSPLPLLPI